MDKSDLDDVVLKGRVAPFRPLAELEAEDRKLNRQQRRAAARARRRKGRK